MLAACGGTLARYVDLGHEVTLAPLRDNVVRAAPAAGAKAAEVLGVRYDNGLVEAADIVDERLARDSFMDAVRRAAPDVIIGPSPLSPLPGDAAAARLVFNGAYGACVPNYPSPGEIAASSVRAAILHMDFGALPLPNDYVDVSEAWDRKAAALASFTTVDEAPEAVDAATTAEIVARARGVQVQLEFVEAFAVERVWGRLRARRLLP